MPLDNGAALAYTVGMSEVLTMHYEPPYRTKNGERYRRWISHPSEERVRDYRKAGIKCFRRGWELFVRETDMDAAFVIDGDWEG